MYALRLTIEGATEEEQRKGLAAASAVFERVGVHPDVAVEGWWQLQGWDLRGFQDSLNDEDSRNASIWLEAEEAAIAACCENWPESKKKSISGGLELLDSESFKSRKEADGTWTIYRPLTGDPVSIVDGGPLTGLDEHEAEEALDMLDEEIIKAEALPNEPKAEV